MGSIHKNSQSKNLSDITTRGVYNTWGVRVRAGASTTAHSDHVKGMTGCR